MTAFDATRAYAADLGWPVLPIWPLHPDGTCACGQSADKCRKPGKHTIGPLVPHGLDGATTDPATIERWFRRFPAANLVARTGSESGVLVLDVEGPEGERALADLERRHGAVPDLSPMQRTGSGMGWQGFLAYAEGRIKLESWEGRDGVQRSGLTVLARVAQPLGQIGKRRPSAQPSNARAFGETPFMRRAPAQRRAAPAVNEPFIDDTEAAIADLMGGGR